VKLNTVPDEYLNSCDFICAPSLNNLDVINKPLFEKLINCLKPGGYLLFRAKSELSKIDKEIVS